MTGVSLTGEDDVMRDVVTSLSSIFGSAEISSVDELTRGVSGTSVFRVHLDALATGVTTAIMKVSAPGATGIRLEAAGEVTRELRVYGLALTTEAAGCVCRPGLLASGGRSGVTWILLEDVGSALDVDWDLDSALAAMRGAAALEVDSAATGRNEAWFVPREHHSFEHHIGAARDSIELLRRTPELVHELGEQVDLEAVASCLGAARGAAAELDGAPHGFQHGDLNNSNMGFGVDGALMLIDWAQAGMAPIGSDVAVFLSGFLGFGGHRGALSQEEFDELIVAEYMGRHPGGATDDAILRVVDLWSTSWAVEARLGAGLPAAWQMERTSPTRAFIIADVREGLLRAVRAAERLST